MLPLLLPIHTATLAVALPSPHAPVNDVTVLIFFYFTDSSFLFFHFFYTNYLGIVIFRFLCARLFTSRRFSRLSLVTLQFTSRKYVRFIQIIVMIIIISATKTLFVPQRVFRRARLCVRKWEADEEVFKGSLYNLRWCSNHS